MARFPFEKDQSIKVHQRGVIAQLCSAFRSHEMGLPEWFKNASSAYARTNTSSEHRVLTLMGGTSNEGAPYIALLDHVGMSVEDLENRFANWGDPEAYLGELDEIGASTVLEGGHGNGGKCYMTQMFDRRAYFYTVRGGRGSCYGFVGDDPNPGYFPDRKTGRGFPVGNATEELRRALKPLGVDMSKLPDPVRLASAASSGFTLIVGEGPKHFDGADRLKKLVDSIMGDPQMQLTAQTSRIFVIKDGLKLKGYFPIELPEIQPHAFAPDPRVIEIPDELLDPVSEEPTKTRPPNAAAGHLILRTSDVSMRYSRKGRHHVAYFAHKMPIGFLAMDNVSRGNWIDRMYGECYLDSLKEFETNERRELADGPLARAVSNWVKEQILEYENEFKKKQKLTASQEQKNKLQALNNVLDKWKNKFLDDASFGASGAGPSEGAKGKRGTKRRPLPVSAAERVTIASPFEKAGIDVWLRMKVEFFDADGKKVQAPPFRWHSSDWAVATVDDNNGVVTHAPGDVDVWIETLDGSLRSAPVRIKVLDVVEAWVEPATIEIRAGKVQTLSAVVRDRGGEEHRNVFMTWLQDDSSVVYVTASGVVMARKPGTTKVYAADDRVQDPRPCIVSVLPAERLAGGESGRAYPKILLSEFDPDPLNPDGESVTLAPEDGPVHQPTPQHVEHNIWWINMRCPLAELYFQRFGSESREWRTYHLERYIEALAKIRLSRDFQMADEELTFDEIERKWREVAAEVQKRALEDLGQLLLEGVQPE